MSAFTPDDLRWLACPACQSPLMDEPLIPAVSCSGCLRLYPVVDGLPILLIDRTLDRH